MVNQVKIDENLPIEVANLFQEAGYDALTVHDQGLTGQSDERILAVCTSEKRIFVSLDLDFADIRHYPPTTYSGLIILRLKRQDKPYILSIMKRVVKALHNKNLAGTLWIVNESQIKVRSQ